MKKLNILFISCIKTGMESMEIGLWRDSSEVEINVSIETVFGENYLSIIRHFFPLDRERTRENISNKLQEFDCLVVNAMGGHERFKRIVNNILPAFEGKYLIIERDEMQEEIKEFLLTQYYGE